MLFAIMFCLSQHGYSKDKGDKKKTKERKTSHQTTVMEIDMNRPHARSVVITEYDRKERPKENKSLSMRTSKCLQVTLKDCNPFKYTYAIDATPVSLFEGRSPFDTIQNNLNKVQSEVTEASNDKKADGTNTETPKDTTAIHDENVALAQVQKKNGVVSARKTIREKNITGIDTTSMETIQATAAHKIMENNRKIENSKNAAVDTNSVSYTETIHKTYKLILDARALLENIKLFESSVKPEDFLNQGTYEKRVALFQLQFDTVIKEYRMYYEDVNRDDTAGANPAAVKKLEKLRGWYREILKSLNSIQNYLVDIQLYNYTLPIDINGSNIDAVQVNVRRTSIKQPAVTDNYSYRVWVKGGIKIDVSAGVFLSSLTDKQYQVKDVDTNADYKTIQRKNTGDLNLGFGSTMNFSLRTGAAWVKPSLNFGVLFTTNTTQKFQFLTSFGLILGKEQRGVLHFGAAFGPVTTLQNGYVDDGSVSYKLGVTGTVPTMEKFDIGYFFGFTYNITQPNVQKDAGQANAE